jgi:hypothetical protein
MRKLGIIILILSSLNILGQDNDNPCDFFSYLSDSIFSDNSFIKYKFKEDSISLIWGYKDFEKVFQTFPCDLAPVNIPSYKWKNDKFICLSFGCGSPCWANIFLPLFDTDLGSRVIYYVFDSDIQNNQIVYEDNFSLTIENLISNKKLNIQFETDCGEAFIGYYIDSISLSNNSFYVRWKDNVDKEEKIEEKYIKKLDLK